MSSYKDRRRRSTCCSMGAGILLHHRTAPKLSAKVYCSIKICPNVHLIISCEYIQVTNHGVCDRVELVVVLHVSLADSRIVNCDLVPNVRNGRSKSRVGHMEPGMSSKNRGPANWYTRPHPNLQKVHTTTYGPVL